MIPFYEGERTCVYCGSQTFEVLEHRGREQLVECAFCLHGGEWAKAVGKPLDKLHQQNPDADGSYRLRSGRFSGMTLREVLRVTNGRRYLEYQARDEGEIGKIVKRFLDEVDGSKPRGEATQPSVA